MSKKPTILQFFLVKHWEKVEKSQQTHRIYKKNSRFLRKNARFLRKKTQGNFTKTLLSANSELVRNAEFCPKKGPDFTVCSLCFIIKAKVKTMEDWKCVDERFLTIPVLLFLHKQVFRLQAETF